MSLRSTSEPDAPASQVLDPWQQLQRLGSCLLRDKVRDHATREDLIQAALVATWVGHAAGRVRWLRPYFMVVLSHGVARLHSPSRVNGSLVSETDLDECVGKDAHVLEVDLQDELAALPPHLQVWVDRIMSATTCQGLAERSGVPAPTIRWQRARALRALRARFARFLDS